MPFETRLSEIIIKAGVATGNSPFLGFIVREPNYGEEEDDFGMVKSRG